VNKEILCIKLVSDKVYNKMHSQKNMKFCIFCIKKTDSSNVLNTYADTVKLYTLRKIFRSGTRT